MPYIWYKTELQLTDFQKQKIDYGIKLQRNMWNFMVEYVNPLVDDKSVNIYTADTSLEEMLFESFYYEIEKSGLAKRMVRYVVDKYIRAWKNRFNPNMTTHGKPSFHSCNKTTQSLGFVSVPNKIKNNCYQIPVYKKNLFGHTNHIKASMVQLKLIEDSTKYLSKYENLKPKNSAIIRRKNRYFLCINYECTYKKNVSMNGEIGLDWGLVDYFIDSNGKRYNIPKSATRQLQRIKALQKVLSKKTKGSKNYEKVVEKLNNAWFRYGNIKKDYIEKLTLELCRNNKLIVIEGLDLIEMRKKTHKSRRRQMNHNSFSTFRTRMVQKSEKFQNCKVIQIDRWFASSQICSNCGKNTGKKPVSVRVFICPHCGTYQDRDTNAAINILNEGKRMLANG